jgi:branched-subunit amino acid ABC-type transport system permease component
MDRAQIVQYCLAGVTVGSIYAIVAIGFNIIYNTTGIINFAQGEFLIVGAMTASSFCRCMPLPLAILLVAITTALGGLLELVFIRRARNATVLQLIVTPSACPSSSARPCCTCGTRRSARCLTSPARRSPA